MICCLLCFLAPRTQAAPNATAIAVSGDNLTRILWNHTADNQMSLWRTDPTTSAFTSANFGPYSGYLALGLAVGANNAPRILWNHNPDNLMSLWQVAANNTMTTANYGPYSGYMAALVGVGTNNIPRILWKQSSGAISLWYDVSGASDYTHTEYGPYSGYAPVALAVDSTNAPRVLWTGPSSTASLWQVAANGAFTHVEYADPAGYVPVGLACGTGGDVRLLWNDGQGDAQVWTIASGGTYTAKIYPSLLSVGLSPSSISGGNSATGTVTLTNPAPAGGVTVALSSSSASASVPGSVTIAAGSSSGTFAVTTTAVTASTAATITATYGGVSKSTMLTITPSSTTLPSLTSIYLGPNGIVAGTSSTGTVTFSGTASNSISVACSSNDPSITVPASLILPANQSSLQFSYAANDVSFPTTATITVSYNGQTQTAQITVQPAIQLTASATGNDTNGQGKISLFWTGVSGATSYNIYRQSTASGAFSRLASNVTIQDAGPVLMPTYAYTDTGLTNGNSYAYYVAGVLSSGSERGTSNVDTDTPDPTGIPWDTGNASSIVAAVQAEAAGAVIPDPEDPDQTPEPVGTLMIASPDGVVYMGNLPDGSPAQAFPAAGYYDATSNQIIYSDGTAGIGSLDAMSIPYLAAQSNSLSSNATIGSTQLLGLPPTGITRQIQSQPGFAGMAATVALPDASDPTVISLTYNGSGHDQLGHPKNYNSVGDIYTGGHIVFPASVVAAAMSKHENLGGPFANIDAGLLLSEYPVANTAWQPVTLGTAHQNILLGGAGGKPVSNLYKIFITGQVLFEFQTPAINRIKDKHILMHYTKPYTADSNLYGNFSITLRRQTGGKDANGNPVYSGNPLNETSVTLFYTGGSAVYWKKAFNSAHPEYGGNNFVIKRTNSIAQTMNPVAATPRVPPVYTNAPVANGPVNGPPFGFYMDGSYLLGGAWGINDTNGVVLLYPGTGYTSWTDSSTVTSLAGSYPLDTRYIKWNPSNPYYYEPNLNMRTSLGTLPGY